MSQPATTTARKYTCALCPGEITVADNFNGGLITVNVDGHARAAHAVCPDPEGEVAWEVTEVREPGIKAAPINLEPGDRIRIVFEGTIEDLEDGFVGPTPVVSNAIDKGVRLPHWLLRASRIERLTRPNTDPVDNSVTGQN